MRDRDLNLLAGAVGLSALGDFLAVVPLALLVEELTGSGTAVAALFIALWSPVVVLGAPAGLLVDRLEARTLLLWVSLAQALVAAALAFVDGMAGILALTALLGSGFALAQPAEFALVPAVAGEERIAAANGRIETARCIGLTLGPLLGGLLAAAGGTQVALLVNSASFVAVAVVAAHLRARRAVDRGRAGDAGPERARDGAVHLFRDRTLGRVVAIAFVSLLFMTASAAAEVFFARDVLGAGDVGYGLLVTAWTLGMVAGSMLVAPRLRGPAAATWAVGAIAVQGAGLALPTLWLALGFAVLAYVVGGGAHGAKNVLVRTLIHERVPEHVRGRAFAAYNALRNGAELVALAGGGLLIGAIGARWTLLLAGALPAVVALAALAAAGARLRAPGPGEASAAVAR